MKGSIWKFLFSFSALCIIVGAVGFWLTYKEPFDASEEKTLFQEQTFDMNDVTHLKISANLASIHLKESTSGEVSVRLLGKPTEDQFHYDIERTSNPADKEKLELHIITEDRPKLSVGSLFGAFHTRDARLATTAEVHLPPDLLETLEVTTMVGNIEAVQFTTEQLILKSDLGKIKLSHVQGSDISIESSVGEIELTNIDAPLKVKTNVGKVSWATAEPAHPVDIHTDVGNVEVKLSQNPVSVELEVLLGTIQSGNVPGLTRIDQEEGTFVHGGIGTGGPLVKVLTNVGNIQVEAARH